MKRRNIKNVRVTVKGFGNGRLVSFKSLKFSNWKISLVSFPFKPSIKALQIGKINIVSITDNTSIPVAFTRPARPPVKRRV